MRDKTSEKSLENNVRNNEIMLRKMCESRKLLKYV